MAERIWTVSEAKSRLSEILRLAEEEGAQRIGARRGYRIVSEREWRSLHDQRPALGSWLTAHLAPGEPLELPSRAEPPRPDPFAEAR